MKYAYITIVFTIILILAFVEDFFDKKPLLDAWRTRDRNWIKVLEAENQTLRQNGIRDREMVTNANAIAREFYRNEFHKEPAFLEKLVRWSGGDLERHGGPPYTWEKLKGIPEPHFRSIYSKGSAQRKADAYYAMFKALKKLDENQTPLE